MSSTSRIVVASFNNPDGNRCVDIFRREDGTFGFEECRRDSEDTAGWFPLHRFGRLVFETDAGALAKAKAEVAWMAPDGG